MLIHVLKLRSMHKTTNMTDLLEEVKISDIGIKISTYNFEAQIRKKNKHICSYKNYICCLYASLLAALGISICSINKSHCEVIDD